MLRPRFRSSAALFVLLGFALPTAAQCDELEELSEKVQAQESLIQELRKDLEALREQKEAENAQEATAAAEGVEGSGEAPVTREYVDKRIEDFETAPESRFLVSGYGTVQYVGEQEASDGFEVGFNPGFHFRMTDRLHFNGELEVGLTLEGEETVTELGLEFAQIDYLLNDWMVLSGGLMLLPFNAFGPRLHPTWINKMASKPPIYGGHGEVGIVPVMSNLGFQVSGGAPLWSDESKFNYGFYVTNAPSADDDHDPLGFEYKTFPNLSDNFSGGGRVGVLPIPNLEIGGSFQSGTVSPTDDPSAPGDRYHLAGSDAWFDWRGLELRGEYIWKTRRFEGTDLSEQGYYLQGAYRMNHLVPDTGGLRGVVGRFEPVVRWGQIFDYAPRIEEKARKQLALGLAYWLFESAPLKFTYEFNEGAVDSNRVFVQFAYGF